MTDDRNRNRIPDEDRAKQDMSKHSGYAGSTDTSHDQWQTSDSTQNEVFDHWFMS